MSGGASVEDTLELCASSLRDVKERIRPLFTQARVAASAGDFLDALLGNEPRKTGWMRARLRVILARGGNKPCWDAVAGMPTHCAMSCGTMLLSIWLQTMPFL